MFFKKNSGAKSSPSLDKSETSTQPKPETRLQNAVAEEDPDMDPVEGTVTQDVEYPTGLKLALIIFSLFASMFLVSLVGILVSS